MISETCSKPLEQPAAEKHVKFNIENQSPNSVSFEVTDKEKI